MFNPLVSVIIPNYCHAKYLDQRIQSVLGQTYQNFEVIILDDASPDNGASKTIIEKYRNNHHVSHIIYNDNNSGSTFIQWNKGFGLAKGEIIWIAESDDYCDYDFLDTLVNCFLSYENVGICYCLSQFVDSDGRIMEPILPKSDNIINLFSSRQFLEQRMAQGNAINNASSCIFKKEYGLLADKRYMNYVAAGDKLFWIELAELSQNIVCVESAKNFFRQHNNKVSPKKKRNGTTSYEDYKIMRYLEKRGYIRFVNRLIVREHYLQEIEQDDFDNEEIRKELTKLWSYNGLISRQSIIKLVNFYYLLRGRKPHFK